MADLTGTKKCERKKITRGERARKRTRARKTAEKDERRSRNVRMTIIGMLCHLLRNSTTSDEDCQGHILHYGLKL